MATMQTETARVAMLFSVTVNKAIDDFEKSDQTGIQAFGAALRKMIAEAKLGSQEWIHFSQVCPHEDNRDGELLIPIEVWKLLLKITRKGWSYIECDKALSCGIPNNTDGDRWKGKAMKLAMQADGLLPPYLPERLTAATAAGSHTTAVLRLLDWAGTHQIPCPDDMFTSLCPNGFLSQAAVLGIQPSFKEPLMKGLEYFHIRHELVQQCPQLMRLLSQSDNAKHTVYCKESPMQTMLSIHRRAIAEGADTDAAWEKIAKACARGLGDEFLPDVRDQCIFVEKLSGGPDAKFLHELDAFWKTLKNVRTIEAKFLKELAISGNWIALSPDVAIGCVMATLSAPANYCQNNVATVFSAMDYKHADGRKSDSIRKAQQMMVALKRIGEKVGIIGESAWPRIHGNFASRLSMFIFGKAAPMRKTYKTLIEIGIDSYAELISQFGAERFVKAPCPWMMPIPIAAVAAAPSVAASIGRGLREVNHGGKLTESALSQMGYVVGATVRKVDAGMNTISEFVLKEFVFTDEDVGHVLVNMPNDLAGTPLTLGMDKLIGYKVITVAPAKVLS